MWAAMPHQPSEEPASFPKGEGSRAACGDQPTAAECSPAVANGGMSTVQQKQEDEGESQGLADWAKVLLIGKTSIIYGDPLGNHRACSQLSNADNRKPGY